MHVLSDAMISVAYFSIPISLISLVRKRTDIRFNWIFALFAAFILLCGITHLAEIWTTWNPAYGLQGLLKLVTGLVSIGTAALLWSLIPKALAFPTLDQLKNANQVLKKEMTTQLEETNLLRSILNAQKELNEAGLDPVRCVETLLEQLQRLLKANGAAYEIIKDNELLYQTAQGFLSPLRNRRFQLEGSISGMCVREKKVISCFDCLDDPRVDASACHELGLRAMILAPLCNGNQVIGVIKAAFQSPRQFTEREMKILEILSNLYESALSNALSYKAGEEAQVQTEEQFRVLADSIPQLAWMARSDGHIFWYNRRWYEYTGTTLEAMEGWGWQSVHHPDYIDQILSDVKHHWQAGKSFEMTFPLRKSTGEYRWFLTRVEPIKDSEGNVVRWFGSNTDITELRHAEEALRKAEETFRTVTDNAASCLFMMDKSGHPMFMNPAAKRVTGYQSIDEIKEKPLHYAVHWKKPDGSPYPMSECPIDNAQAALVAAQNQDEIFCTKDGRLFPVVYSIAPLEKDGEVVGSVLEFRDVTEAKLAEAALKESEAKFRIITEAMPQMVWATRGDGYHDYYNRRWYEYTGVPPGSTDGEEWNGMFHPEDQERAWKAWRHSLEAGDPYEIEYRLRHHSGIYRWVLGRALPVRDEDGKIIRWMGTCTDIDDQKRAAELLEQRVGERTAELEAANRELEAFSYSVSHDLRAPLRGIDGFSEAVIGLYADRLDEQGKDFLRRIRAATQRMGQLIDEMLTLSRVTRKEMQRTEIDLSALVRAVADDLLGKEPERQVTFDIEPGLKAKADPVLLRTTLENLLGNAWKFTSKREKAHIFFGAQSLAGEMVYFVKDNGAGFNMEYDKKLFMAFQRLHRQTEFPGTGIGLATVQRVIHRHGGRVWGEGKEGEGATFYFTLGDQSKKAGTETQDVHI
jgi:PAS domain S-box-containing protein